MGPWDTVKSGSITIVVKGNVVGHEFHGNQYTAAAGNAPSAVAPPATLLRGPAVAALPRDEDHLKVLRTEVRKWEGDRSEVGRNAIAEVRAAALRDDNTTTGYMAQVNGKVVGVASCSVSKGDLEVGWLASDQSGRGTGTAVMAQISRRRPVAVRDTSGVESGRL